MWVANHPFKKHRTSKCKSDSDTDDDACIERQGCEVYFYADVTLPNVRKMLKLLHKASRVALSQRGFDARTLLYIHSDGGDLHAGMTALDHLERSTVPVWTVCDGFVASAATIMALGGARRFALPHATLLVHALSTYIEGRFPALKEETQNAQIIMDVMASVYVARTSLKDGDVRKMLKKESLMTMTDAVEHGFVEGVLPEFTTTVAPTHTKQPMSKKVNTHIRFNSRAPFKPDVGAT